jgi:hypothetical protein
LCGLFFWTEDGSDDQGVRQMKSHCGWRITHRGTINAEMIAAQSFARQQAIGDFYIGFAERPAI